MTSSSDWPSIILHPYVVLFPCPLWAGLIFVFQVISRERLCYLSSGGSEYWSLSFFPGGHVCRLLVFHLGVASLFQTGPGGLSVWGAGLCSSHRFVLFISAGCDLFSGMDKPALFWGHGSHSSCLGAPAPLHSQSSTLSAWVQRPRIFVSMASLAGVVVTREVPHQTTPSSGLQWHHLHPLRDTGCSDFA